LTFCVFFQRLSGGLRCQGLHFKPRAYLMIMGITLWRDIAY
jgi:hypothetical protein